MNTQEAYEAIRDYFSRPHAVLAKGVDDFGGDECKYRNESGDKCAVGCLIPDGIYTPAFEGTALYGLLKKSPLLKGYLWDVEPEFLANAQYAHDKLARDARAFVTTLDLLARAHGLQVSAEEHYWWFTA